MIPNSASFLFISLSCVSATYLTTHAPPWKRGKSPCKLLLKLNFNTSRIPFCRPPTWPRASSSTNQSKDGCECQAADYEFWKDEDNVLAWQSFRTLFEMHLEEAMIKLLEKLVVDKALVEQLQGEDKGKPDEESKNKNKTKKKTSIHEDKDWWKQRTFYKEERDKLFLPLLENLGNVLDFFRTSIPSRKSAKEFEEGFLDNLTEALGGLNAATWMEYSVDAMNGVESAYAAYGTLMYTKTVAAELKNQAIAKTLARACGLATEATQSAEDVCKHASSLPVTPYASLACRTAVGSDCADAFASVVVEAVAAASGIDLQVYLTPLYAVLDMIPTKAGSGTLGVGGVAVNIAKVSAKQAGYAAVKWAFDILSPAGPYVLGAKLTLLAANHFTKKAVEADQAKKAAAVQKECAMVSHHIVSTFTEITKGYNLTPDDTNKLGTCQWTPGYRGDVKTDKGVIIEPKWGPSTLMYAQLSVTTDTKRRRFEIWEALVEKLPLMEKLEADGKPYTDGGARIEGIPREMCTDLPYTTGSIANYLFCHVVAAKLREGGAFAKLMSDTKTVCEKWREMGAGRKKKEFLDLFEHPETQWWPDAPGFCEWVFRTPEELGYQEKLEDHEKKYKIKGDGTIIITGFSNSNKKEKSGYTKTEANYKYMRNRLAGGIKKVKNILSTLKTGAGGSIEGNTMLRTISGKLDIITKNLDERDKVEQERTEKPEILKDLKQFSLLEVLAGSFTKKDGLTRARSKQPLNKVVMKVLRKLLHSGFAKS